MKKNIVAPSILSADFAHLAADIDMLNQSLAEWIHIDVMDGVFVPNISFGFPILRAVRSKTKKICDVHLMITQPERYIEHFCRAGADVITVHYEGNHHLDSLIKKIQLCGAQAGVALNPSTPVSVLKEVIHLLDVVLIMSVNPGFGGQSFIPYTVEKVAEAKELIRLRNSKALIEVDGGITLENAPMLTAAGATVLVAGNTIFSASHPIEVIASLATA